MTTPKDPPAAQTHPIAKKDLPFEGLRMVRPKKTADYQWIAVLGFGMNRMGGVGDSQEEAAVALLEQVLVSTEKMLAKAATYGVVESRVISRVRSLTQKFIAELRALHRDVLADQEREAPYEEILNPEAAKARAPKSSVETASFDVADDEIDEDTLL